MQTETVLALAPNDTKGFLGERYDADAGLQYLNARCYDPALALFIQPDWFPAAEVLRGAFVARDGKFMDVVPGTPHGRAWLDGGFFLVAEVAGRAAAQIAALLAEWLLRQGAVKRLADPALTGATVVAALNRLKSSARTLEDYRGGSGDAGADAGACAGAVIDLAGGARTLAQLPVERHRTFTRIDGRLPRGPALLTRL